MRTAAMGCGTSKHGGSAAVDTGGLKSDDLEVVRGALFAALSRGNVNEDTAAAERRLREGRSLPPDWDIRTYCNGQRKLGADGGRQGDTVVAYERQAPAVVQAVQTIFDSTYRKVYTRDRRGAPIPDRFVIKEVHRVLNDQVWREYSAQRDKVRAACGAQRPTVPDGALTTNTVHQQRLESLPALDTEVNEHWLFHGTTAAGAQGITQNDFRLDLSGSNAGTLYGKGVYLAENASKSDEYGEGPKGPAGEEAEMGFEAPRPPPGPPPPLVRESYILLCRSVLGRMNITEERRPDADALQKSCVSGQFDSVLGDRLKINGTFREIVVYSDDHVYPEYVVKYERIFFHERFAEIYRAMLQRRAAGRFQGPTNEELQVLQSLWSVYGMPNKGKVNKWQLLDLLMAVFQPPQNDGEDLDATFQEWDTNKDGFVDWDEFLQEIVQRVKDGISCSGPERFAEIFQLMLERRRSGNFDGPDVGEANILRMVWYCYANNAKSIDKWQLLDLLKAIGQPPADEGADLDATFAEIDANGDGVIDYDEFLKEVIQRVKDGDEC
mmetsp:Transcript_14336/g.32601  ORF Transcript_14336/g.32601 Transcript_14336/m.32601 type:complete len:552 (-) Transcript_14336:223-1878(-)